MASKHVSVPRPEGPFELNVLIVGGGLFGLAAAISIASSGHQVTIFEAHSGPHEVGAGLQSSPNGTRLWYRWGLSHILEPLAAAPTALQIHDHDGKLLARRQNYDIEIKRRYGYPLWTIHRRDLQTSLIHRARELGVKILYSTRIDEVDIEKPAVKSQTRETHIGDVVIVAGGIWSSLRSGVLGKQVDPEPTGDMAYRMTVDYDDLDEEKELQNWMHEPTVRIWVGPRSHAVAYPVRGARQLNIVLLVQDDIGEGHESNVAADLAEMTKHFECWDPILNKMLGTVQSVSKWRLMQLPPLETWRSPQGTTVIGGDCCHAILPYMAQGLNLGLEDAAVLGYLLGRVTRKEQISKATAMYEDLRMVRTARMLEETHKHAEHFHTTDEKVRTIRNVEFSRSFDPASDCTVLTSTHPWDKPFSGICPSTEAPSMVLDNTSLSNEHDPAYEITWAHQDPENPKNWPAWYRGLVLGFTSFGTLIVVMTSTAYVTTIPGVMSDFGIIDRTIPVLGVTTYLFGLGFGPLVIAALAETFGRRPLYAVSLFLFCILQIPSAVASNMATLLSTRFFSGFVGSVMLSNAPGTVNDIALNETRALYVSVLAGKPVFGPVIAGVIYQYGGWRWIHWTMAILSFVSAVMMTSITETFPPAILSRRSMEAKKENARYWSKYDDFRQGTLVPKLKSNLTRPIAMALSEPIWQVAARHSDDPQANTIRSLLWNTYIAILYALLYLSIVGYPIVFQQIRGWRADLAGLPFLSIGLGSLLCILAEPYMRYLVKALDRFSRQQKYGVESDAPSVMQPEATLPLIFLGGLLVPVGMLLFALSASPPNSIVVAILSGIPFGVGNMLVIIYVTSYLASCYGLHAASALAGNAAMRNFIGGLLPLLAPIMYNRLGPLVTGLALMGATLALTAVPLIFWKYGIKLRRRSRLAI
ncbi:putative Major facilitator superfamily (MFS) profile domain-containing protein [Seiridium unicorne]|uniref:Major facilitator superfamily (MFS) profile domain-containing protein n=1 Tax=Seiridium unicorne TaxID=138068 RepID=A0ABR2UFQ1_9PEZI